jgi:hypothetical protein
MSNPWAGQGTADQRWAEPKPLILLAMGDRGSISSFGRLRPACSQLATFAAKEFSVVFARFSLFGDPAGGSSGIRWSAVCGAIRGCYRSRNWRRSRLRGSNEGIFRVFRAKLAGHGFDGITTISPCGCRNAGRSPIYRHRQHQRQTRPGRVQVLEAPGLDRGDVAGLLFRFRNVVGGSGGRHARAVRRGATDGASSRSRASG